jgi:hypothetical protein
MDQVNQLLNNIKQRLPQELIHRIVEEYENQYYQEYLVTCDNCGRMWDGNAQCNCYMFED